tara:strand:- start:41 stop:496 length:456 start_codon:yes stop_codon:yes gene_type:complete
LLKSILNILHNKDDPHQESDNDELKLLTGIMIEAANTDGSVSQEEINKITSLLIDIFGQDRNEVEKSIEEALIKKDDPKSLYFYTSKINKSFSLEKKILLIETLWEIILADGKIHDFESNLIRRLAGLLYISDVSCGNAKTKALLKINKRN